MAAILHLISADTSTFNVHDLVASDPLRGSVLNSTYGLRNMFHKLQEFSEKNSGMACEIMTSCWKMG